MDKKFSADLPSRCSGNFSTMSTAAREEDQVKIAYDVPKQPTEQKILNENRPCILRFLEKLHSKKVEAKMQKGKTPKTVKKRPRHESPGENENRPLTVADIHRIRF